MVRNLETLLAAIPAKAKLVDEEPLYNYDLDMANFMAISSTMGTLGLIGLGYSLAYIATDPGVDGIVLCGIMAPASIFVTLTGLGWVSATKHYASAYKSYKTDKAD